MNKKTVWLLGGTAAGGLILWNYMRKRPPQLQGLGGLGAASDEEAQWRSVHDQGSNLFNELTKRIEPLPENLKSGYANVLWIGAGSIYPQIMKSYNLGVAKNYPAAMIWAQAALKNLQRIAPLIAADVADNTGQKSEVIIKQRLDAIAKAQEANEADRQLAEKGAMAYVLGKTGEAVGSAAGSLATGVGTGIKGFMKKIPWWVYVLGVGGVGTYFFWPVIVNKIRTVRRGMAAKATVPAPVPVPVQTNPRRRGLRHKRVRRG